MTLIRFVIGSVRLVTRGGPVYWTWVGSLLAMVVAGAAAYAQQMQEGLIATSMRDQVSWGFYIGNFTFLVGVAAAAVMLVIPAYIYDWKPIKEIVILGELLAISAVVMCLLFVTVDIGQPARAWHLLPVVGRLNFPQSILAWDVLVLTLYFLLNWGIVTYILHSTFYGREPDRSIVFPLVLLSIPAAVSIHTVTAFLYNGLAARPFWNSSILAPRFLCSAFCSGPAILLVLLQVLRRTARLQIRDEAIWKIAELMAYAMALNIFLAGAEVFKEYYSDTEHLVYTKYLYQGLGEHRAIVGYAYLAVFCNIASFLLFLIPATRHNPVTLNLGALMIYGGVYIEKGLGLVIPDLTPDALGEVYEYRPSLVEVLVSMGIFATGFLLFTAMVKVAIPIMQGEFGHRQVISQKTAAD